MGDEEGFRKSNIAHYGYKTSSPRFTTVLYPYKDARPYLEVSPIPPDGAHSDLATAVKIVNGESIDVVAWGDPAEGEISFGNVKHVLDGEMLAVRTTDARDVRGFSWYNARRMAFNGKGYAQAQTPIAMLDVTYTPTAVQVEVREEDPGLVIWIGDAETVTVNGRLLTDIKPYDGYLRLFPSKTRSVVVDDNSPGFRRITQTTEWEIISDARAFGCTYTRHETDPGRREAAAYSREIPTPRTYRVEAFIPETTRRKTDTMHYTVQATPGRAGVPAEVGGVIKAADADAKAGRFMLEVDQTDAVGWIDLGAYHFNAGKTEFLNATNRTQTDGLYPTFDAVRLTPLD